MLSQNDKELNSNSNRLNILGRIQQYTHFVFTNILTLLIAIFSIYWTYNPEKGNSLVAFLSIIAVIILLIIIIYSIRNKNKIDAMYNSTFTFLSNHIKEFLFNLFIYWIMIVIVVELSRPGIRFFSLIFTDISNAGNLISINTILGKVIFLPLLIGFTLKLFLLWVQITETISFMNKTIFDLLIGSIQFLFRIFLVISAGALLSVAFNPDNESNIAKSDTQVNSVIFTNITFNINDGVSVNFINTSLNLNADRFNAKKQAQNCNIENNEICDRWNYLMTVMLYVGYEIFTPYIEMFLKRKYRGKNIKNTTEHNSKKIMEEVKGEEVIEISQVDLTEEIKATESTKHGPELQRSVSKKKKKRNKK